MQKKKATKKSKREARRNPAKRLENVKRVLGSLAMAVFWNARRLNFLEFGLAGSIASFTRLCLISMLGCCGLAGGFAL